MNTEVFEITTDDIELVSGTALIDPPSALSSDVYPEVDNDPPVPPA